MPVVVRAALAALLLLPGAATAVGAQIDYRNLDDERPVRTEDAYPVDRYAVEILTPLTFESTSGTRQYLLAPEVEMGAFHNTQVGAKVPLALSDGPTGTTAGIGGAFLYALYNFNTESPSLPALSLRADLSLPLGSLGGTGVRTTLKALATRSWGRWRAHVNLAGTLGPDSDLGIDALPRWVATFAVDHTLYRQSVLLVGDLAVLEPAQGADTQVQAAVGLRWQWRATTVLDAGVRRRLSAAGPDIQLTIGLSHALAFRALMPGARVKEESHAAHH